MAHPSDLRVAETSPGAALVSWTEVKGASYYMMYGSGMGGGGQRRIDWVPSAPGVPPLEVGVYVYGVPSGLQDFMVASYYPGDVTPSSPYARATITMSTPAPAAPASPAASAAPGGVATTGVATTRAPTAPPARTPQAALVIANPSDLLAGERSPGEVGLSWSGVKGASYYVVFWPGFGNAGRRVDDVPPTEPGGVPRLYLGIGGVPVGTHEFAVASYFPGNVTTPASQFARVSITINKLVIANPSDLKAVETSPGTVLLSWTEVKGAYYYDLFGPGIGSAGLVVNYGEFNRPDGSLRPLAQSVSGVPSGQQQFAVASHFYGAVTTTPQSQFSRVNIDVSPAPAAGTP